MPSPNVATTCTSTTGAVTSHRHQRQYRGLGRSGPLVRLGITESACDAGEIVARRIHVDPRPPESRRQPGALGVTVPVRECAPSRSRANTLAKLRLARYSQQLMDQLAAREGLQYWQSHAGVLYLFHEEADLLAAEHSSQLLQEHGRRQEVLDFQQTIALEPALGNGPARFAGAIHDTSDGTGNPQQFAISLAAGCRTLGVTFHLGTSVERLDTDGSLDHANPDLRR